MTRKSSTRRAKGGIGTIWARLCATPVASTKRGRKSAGRSNATINSGTRPSRGSLGTTSPRSRQTPETAPARRRRRARPSDVPRLPARRRGEPRVRRPRLPRRDAPLLAGDAAAAASFLQQLAADPESRLAPPPSKPSKPSSSAAATAPSPTTPRISITRWPRKSSS